MKWTDLLDGDVFLRLAECRSTRSDIIPLTQAKWNAMKSRQGFTKEDALISILELLECNSQAFDLTSAEYTDILNSIL